MDILDCRFKIPRKNNWVGHPFYYEILKGFASLVGQEPRNIVDLYQTPIWFNSQLKTKFDIELSKLGFAYPNDSNIARANYYFLGPEVRELFEI